MNITVLQIGKIYPAVILKSIPGGLFIRIENSQIKEILHSREIPEKSRAALEPGQQIKIKVYDIAVQDEKQRYLVSMRLAEHDPWDNIEQDLGLGAGQKRAFVMEVDEITGKHAFGEIKPAVRACVDLAAFRNYFQGKKIETTMQLLPQRGDLVAGYIQSRPDWKNRIIHLDAIAYIEERHSINRESVIPEIPINPPAAGKNNHKAVNTIKKILVVDDDAVLCGNLRQSLELEEYTVFAATTHHAAQKARDILKEEPIDLILLDAHIPELADSIELLKILESEHPHTKIILVSGDPELLLQPDLVPIREIKIIDYLPKPFAFSELCARISQAEQAEPQALEAFIASGRITEEVGSQKPVFDTLPGILENELQQLITEINADAGAVFEMHKRTFEVIMPVYYNINYNTFLNWRAHLATSLVKDCAIDKKNFFTNSAMSSGKGIHRYLLKILEYSSCIGIPVESPGDTARALFLFNISRIFIAKDQDKAERAAIHIAGYYMKHFQHNIALRNNREINMGITYSMLGHELSNKLLVMDNTIHIMKKYLEKEQPDKAFLINKIKDIESVSNEIAKITNIYKDYTKKSNPLPLDILNVLNKAIKDSLSYAQHETILCKITPPRAASPLPAILARETELTQVFFNLLINAMQQCRLFWPDQQADIKVTAEQVKYQDKACIQVEISDNGPGIHKADFENIFERMFSTRLQGAGLGLASCKDTLRNMGGEITIKNSILFVGTTFRLYIPVNKENRNA